MVLADAVIVVVVGGLGVILGYLILGPAIYHDLED